MKNLKYLVLMILIAFWSCNLGSDIDQNEGGGDAVGASLKASFYLPNWNLPKDGMSTSQGRFIDPDSSYVSLSVDNSWVQDIFLTGENTIDNTINKPNSIASVTFTGLEAKTYQPGSLKIEIFDASDNLLSTGSNLGEVTLTAQGDNAIEFSCIPDITSQGISNTSTGITVPSSMHYAVGFTVTGPYVYRLNFTRTSATGDIDIYIFDSNGRLIAYDYSTEVQDTQKTIYFVSTSGGSDTYYAVYKEFTGNGDVIFDFDIAQEGSNTSYAICGILNFPAATAGDVVKFSYANSNVLNMEIGRTGDTYLYYTIPNLSNGSGYLSAYIDRDSSGTNNAGDYNTTSPVSVSISGSSKKNINLDLAKTLKISGSITLPETISSGTYMFLGVLNELGDPIASNSRGTVSSDIVTSMSYTVSIPKPGKYRAYVLFDIDQSSYSKISNPGELAAAFTPNDIYYISDIFTVTDSDIVSNGSSVYASVIEGQITMPEARTYANYVVFADDDLIYSNGIKAGLFSYVGSSLSTTFDYRLVVPKSVNYYIGALVDGVGSQRLLNSGDYLGYLDTTPASYTGLNSFVDFSVDYFATTLSGSLTLPTGVGADGREFIAGILSTDTWSNPALIPTGTGPGGTFNYNLDGIPLGNNLEVVVLVDMDGNGFDSGPNNGDIVGYQQNINFSDPISNTLNFSGDSVIVATPSVSGQILNSDDSYFSGMNYIIKVDGEIQEQGVTEASPINYHLNMVDNGDHVIAAFIDKNNNGFYGDSGDYIGKLDFTVDYGDIEYLDVLTSETGIFVGGFITLPEDFFWDISVIVSLTNDDPDKPSYQRTFMLYSDDDLNNDIVKYGFHGVEPGSYTLSVIADSNSNGYGDTGEYEGYYPFGQDVSYSESITVLKDMKAVNFIVPSSSQI